MTKTNFFGDTIYTPQDSPADFAEFADERGAGGFYGARISDNGDDEIKWCASVDMNEVSGDLSVQGFESEAELRSWLVDAGVPKNEIELEEEG